MTGRVSGHLETSLRPQPPSLAVSTHTHLHVRKRVARNTKRSVLNVLWECVEPGVSLIMSSDNSLFRVQQNLGERLIPQHLLEDHTRVESDFGVGVAVG